MGHRLRNPGPDSVRLVRSAAAAGSDAKTMADPSEIEDQIVASIRRIIRAIDLQSRRLQDLHKLTGPQLATLRAAHKLGPLAISALARAVHLSQPTVSGILNRLERGGLVIRRRSPDDRRTVVIDVTPEGQRVLQEAPSLLQEQFRAELARLEDWERHWMLSALERIASMMDAEGIDAAPILETGPVAQPGDESPLPEPHDAPAGTRDR
jgi:DNA-binding MarR family transcriptional regulator